MNVSITIDTITVSITEKGYDRLRSNMDSLLNSVPESMRELVSADAEKRLAEYFSNKLAAGRTLLTEEDVDAAFAELGFGKAAEEKSNTETNGAPNEAQSDTSNTEADGGQDCGTTNSGNSNGEKRANHSFWLSKTQVVIGGVCGGIAEKYDIDVVWVRLALVAITLFLFQPWILAVYLILWIILPINSSGVDGDVVLNGADRGGRGCLRGCFIALVIGLAVLAIGLFFAPLWLFSLMALHLC